MARPTGQKSRARRIPLDLDDAIDARATHYDITWADALRLLVDHVPDTRSQPDALPDPPRRLGSFADVVRDHAESPPTPLRAPDAVVPAGTFQNDVEGNPRPVAAAITGTIEYVERGERVQRQLREVRCRCAKPSMSKTVTNLCTACGHIR